jgi:hypothetical protein
MGLHRDWLAANKSVRERSVMAGYSGTPLVKKLGIKENFNIGLVGAPQDFLHSLAPMPKGVSIHERPRKPLDFAMLFVKREADLKKKFAKIAARLNPSGMIWVAWPKKARE